MATFCQLKQFLVLSDILHFGRAAKKLGIAQAALSKSIGKLESDLGVLLLDREDRHAVRLTAAGEDYAVRCRRLLAEFEEAAHAARRLAGGECGELQVRLAGSSAVCPEVLKHLAEMYYAHPDVRMRISSSASGAGLQEALMCQEISFGVCTDDGSESVLDGISRQEIARYTDPLMLAFPASHPVLTGKFPDGLQNSHFILPGPEEQNEVSRLFRNYFINTFHRDPVVIMEIENPASLAGMAVSGVGIGVLPRRDALPFSGVVYRELPLQICRKIWGFFRTDDHSPVIKNLRACMRAM